MHWNESKARYPFLTGARLVDRQKIVVLRLWPTHQTNLCRDEEKQRPGGPTNKSMTTSVGWIQAHLWSDDGVIILNVGRRRRLTALNKTLKLCPIDATGHSKKIIRIEDRTKRGLTQVPRNASWSSPNYKGKPLLTATILITLPPVMQAHCLGLCYYSLRR